MLCPLESAFLPVGRQNGKSRATDVDRGRV